MAFLGSKRACISFEFAVYDKGLNINTSFEDKNELFSALREAIKLCKNSKLNGVSMSLSENGKLLVDGSIITKQNDVPKIVELLSSDGFKQSLIRFLRIPESTQVGFSFSTDSERESCVSRDENDSKNGERIVGSGKYENGEMSGYSGDDSKCEEKKEEYWDDIETLMDSWNEYINGGIDQIDVIIQYALALIDSSDTRVALLNRLLNDNVGLITSTCRLALKDETQFEKVLLFVNRLILYGGNNIFKIFESTKLDEILMSGLIEHGRNVLIVKRCLNIIDIMMNESNTIWQKLISDKYGIGAILLELGQCSENELRSKEDLIVGMVNLIHGIFSKSRCLKCRSLPSIFKQFVEHYLDSLVKMVLKIGWCQLSIEFCVLLKTVLRSHKVNMIKFENDLLYNKWYDILKMLVHILVSEIEENDFYSTGEVMQVLIMLLSNTGNEGALKCKLSKQEYFLNFQLLLVDYIEKWQIYYGTGNNDFDNMIGYMIQFLYLWFSNNKGNYNNDMLSLEYLHHMIPLTSMRMKELAWGIDVECKLYIWRLIFVGNSDNSCLFALNTDRTRKNILFPGISNANISNHVKDSNETFRKRNRLYDIFGKYFCDGQYVYCFSNCDLMEYDLGYSFNEYVNIKLVKVGCLQVNGTIESLFNYCFDYGNDIDIDVNDISAHFLQSAAHFRQVIKNEAVLLDRLMGKNFLCWAQAYRLYDDFDSPACRTVKDDNDLRMHMFKFLKGIDIIQLNKTGKKWYRITSPLITWNDKNDEWFIDLWGRGSGRKWLNNDSSERIMNGYNRIVENRIKRDVNFVKKWFYQCSHLYIVKFLHLKLDLLDESRRDGAYNYIRNINDKCDIIINEYQTYLYFKDYKILYYGKEFVSRTFTNMFDLLYTFVDSDDLKLLKKLICNVSIDIGSINGEIRSLNEMNENDIWPRNDTLQCFACYVIKVLLRACLKLLNEVILMIENNENMKN